MVSGRRRGLGGGVGGDRRDSRRRAERRAPALLPPRIDDLEAAAAQINDLEAAAASPAQPASAPRDLQGAAARRRRPPRSCRAVGMDGTKVLPCLRFLYAGAPPAVAPCRSCGLEASRWIRAVLSAPARRREGEAGGGAPDRDTAAEIPTGRRRRARGGAVSGSGRERREGAEPGECLSAGGVRSFLCGIAGRCARWPRCAPCAPNYFPDRPDQPTI
ncbi:unnamed protein product [Urochloa humidicola]